MFEKTLFILLGTMFSRRNCFYNIAIKSLCNFTSEKNKVASTKISRKLHRVCAYRIRRCILIFKEFLIKYNMKKD